MILCKSHLLQKKHGISGVLNLRVMGFLWDSYGFGALETSPPRAASCTTAARATSRPWPRKMSMLGGVWRLHKDSPVAKDVATGLWWLEHDFYFPIQLGISSSHLTNSYFSEGLKFNHQPVISAYFFQKHQRVISVISHKIPLNHH